MISKPLAFCIGALSVLTAVMVLLPKEASTQTPNPVILSSSPLTGNCPPRRFNVATGSTSIKFCDPFANAWTTMASGTVNNPSSLFTQTNSVSATTSGSFQTLTGTGTGSTTLGANFFTAGSQIRLTIGGSYTTGATPGNLTETVQIFGVSFSTSAIGFNSNLTGAPWNCNIMLTALTTGVSGSMLARGACYLGTANAGGGSPLFWTFQAASQTVNTTGSTTVNYGVLLSAAGNTVTADQLEISTL